MLNRTACSTQKPLVEPQPHPPGPRPTAKKKKKEKLLPAFECFKGLLFFHAILNIKAN